MIGSNRVYNYRACVVCGTTNIGIQKIDLTVISELICLECAKSMTVGQFTRIFKWKPTLIQNKLLIQITKPI